MLKKFSFWCPITSEGSLCQESLKGDVFLLGSSRCLTVHQKFSMWWKLDSASGQARSVLSPEEAVVFLLWFCDLWSTEVSWLDKIGWLPKTVPAFEAWGNWVTLVLYGAWKVSVWNTTRGLEWGVCVSGGFCVFGKRISVLGIHLFVMISVVSEQNFSEPTTSYLSAGA